MLTSGTELLNFAEVNQEQIRAGGGEYVAVLVFRLSFVSVVRTWCVDFCSLLLQYQER